MKKRRTFVVASVLMVVVIVAGFARFMSLRILPDEKPIGLGVTVSGNNLPDNLNATSVNIPSPVDPQLAQIASLTFEIGPSGNLASAITLHLPLIHAVTPGSKLIIMTAESPKGPWTPLAATLSQDRRSVSVVVNHLSIFEVILLDLAALLQAFEDNFANGLTSNLFTRAEPPRCQNESEVRADGYSIVSSKTDTLYWCFGLSNGRPQLVAVNTRRYVLAVQYPYLTVLSSSQPVGALERLAQLEDSINHEVLILPSEEARFRVDIAVGAQAGIKTQADAGEELMYSLETGVNALLEIITRFGYGGAFPILEKMNAILGLTDCADIVQQSIRADSVNFGEVMSTCLSPDDIAEVFGSWGVILAAVMTVSSIVAYFASSVQGLVDIALGRDQYEVIISRGFPSPCPPDAGQCLGIRSGDIDGDGKPDEVGLTHEAGSTQVVAHVVFATGATAEGDFDISNYVIGGNPVWLGLSDITGDGKDEIFLQVSSGEVQLTEILAYYNGNLQKVRGNMPSTLVLGMGGTNNVAGIGCRVVGSSSQLITFDGATVGDNFNPINSSPVQGTQTVYQADGSGAMLEVNQQTVTTTYGQIESMFGHCPGLGYP